MRITPAPLPGLFLVGDEPSRDERGSFTRIFSSAEFSRHGLEPDLTEVSLSDNPHRGTLRGMHFQRHPHSETKLVRVVRGSVFDAVVDIRPGSPTFGRWFGLELTALGGLALYIPRGFAHGFLTLAEDTVVLYHISPTFCPAAAAGFHWNDPGVAIEWPATPSTISEKDRTLPALSSLAL